MRQFDIPCIVLFLVLGSLAVSCSPKAPTMTLDGTATADLAVEKIFQEACEHFDKGNIGEADEGFARIIREFPNEAPARAAAVYRARIALKLDNPERARALLAPIKGDADPIAERALLYDGAALARLGRFEDAVAVLEPLVDKMTDPEDVRVLEENLWNAAREAGDMKRAAASMDRLLSVLENRRDQREALRAFKRALVSLSDLRQLEQAEASLPATSKVRAAVDERRASVHMEAGQFQKAREILDALERNIETSQEEGLPPPSAQDLVAEEDIDFNAVGLLAPLSGRARLVGDAALKGAVLGAEESGVRLLIRDSKGTAEAAAEAVESLVVRDRVSAIVGPLTPEAARAAARKAEELGVPILVMSGQEDITAVGDFVFREFAANKTESVALIDLCRARGARRFGILFPDTGYGRAMRAMYVSALQAAGLSPTAEASYPSDAVNFKEQAEALFKEDLDVLFLAEHSSKIPLIAPALAAAGLRSASYGPAPEESGRPIQLIVPSVGFSEDLIRRAGRYLDGALFCVFFAPEAGDASQAFASKYHLKFGARPDVIAAYGRDAVLIAASGLKDNVRSRIELRRWLVERAAAVAPSIGTATPFEGFTQNGAPKALPYILEIVDSKFVVVEKARGEDR